ncbi:MAG: glutathione S-transferase C-terminal domain-containing protein, partial [bacterium]
RMFDTEFGEFSDSQADFYPRPLRALVDQTIDAIYEPINNGVYRAGFAATQQAHEEAVTELFRALDDWEEVLEKQRFLCGAVVSEADWCLFTTLVRFDAVYHTHFKCNLRRIVDYPNLWNYLKELYQMPGVAETCDFDHIKGHYFGSHLSLNPRGIVPLGPVIDLDAPHGRAAKFAS